VYVLGYWCMGCRHVHTHTPTHPSEAFTHLRELANSFGDEVDKTTTTMVDDIMIQKTLAEVVCKLVGLYSNEKYTKVDLRKATFIVLKQLKDAGLSAEDLDVRLRTRTRLALAFR
jgi:hypothetical protein